MRILCMLLATSLAATLTALAGPPAMAEPTWLPAVEVSDVGAGESEAEDELALAVDPTGTTLAVWTATDPGEDERTVRFAERAVGSSGYTAEIEISASGAFAPQIASDAAGNVVVAWGREVDEERASIVMAWRPVGHSGFLGPLEVSGPGRGLQDYAMVLDAAGYATVVWREESEESPDGVLWSAAWHVGETAWSSPDEPIARGQDLGHVSAVVDGTGHVTAAWWAADEGPRVYVTERARGGGFTPPDAVSSVGAARRPLGLSTNAAGDTAIAWVHDVLDAEGRPATRLRAAVRHRGSGFGDEEDASPVLATHQDPRVVVDDAGNVTALWLGRPAHVWPLHLSAAERPAGGTFGPPIQLSTGAVARGRIAAGGGSDGVLTVAWAVGDESGQLRIQAARREKGGFSGPVDVSPPARSVDPAGLVTDSGGEVTLGWWVGGTDSRYLASVLDVRGPQVSWGAVGPGVAGQVTALSVSATDRWSGPVSVVWDFGDGTRGAGATTSHVYAAAGSYLVRATATDAVGNATTLSHAIRVVDRTAPVLTRARLVPAVLPTGRGARLRVTASESARLVGVIERRRDGRWRKSGTKGWGIQAGTNTERFYGKAAQQRLRTGRYRVRLTATDATGNTSATTTLRFRVERG